MAVQRDQNNTYYVDFKVKDSSGTWRHICKRGFKTLKDAKKWEAEYRKNPPVKSEQTPSYTFDDIFKSWLANLQVSDTSRVRYEAHIDSRFTKLRGKQINYISKGDLLEWRAWLLSTDYATRTKNATITLVRSIFKFGADMYNLPNPSGCLRRFKQTDQELLKEITVWTPEEFDRFISCVADNTYHLFFEFLFWTGCSFRFRRFRIFKPKPRGRKKGAIPY